MIEEINLKNAESLWAELVNCQQKSNSDDEINTGSFKCNTKTIPALSVLTNNFKIENFSLASFERSSLEL